MKILMDSIGSMDTRLIVMLAVSIVFATTGLLALVILEILLNFNRKALVSLYLHKAAFIILAVGAGMTALTIVTVGLSVLRN